MVKADWLEMRGALLRQLRGVLERDGWEDDIGGYEYLRYRKGGWYSESVLSGMKRTGGLAISCVITPYRGSGLSITGYWVTFRIPLKTYPRPGERCKLRRFRTTIDKGINEAMVLSKIESLFGDEKILIAQTTHAEQLSLRDEQREPALAREYDHSEQLRKLVE